MSAIEDMIAAIGVVGDQLADAHKAHGVAAKETEGAIGTAQALGTEGVVAALDAVQERLKELSARMTEAEALAAEALAAAHLAKT